MFRYIAPVFKAPKMMPARMMPNGESLARAATEMPAEAVARRKAADEALADAGDMHRAAQTGQRAAEQHRFHHDAADLDAGRFRSLHV